MWYLRANIYTHLHTPTYIYTYLRSKLTPSSTWTLFFSAPTLQSQNSGTYLILSCLPIYTQVNVNFVIAATACVYKRVLRIPRWKSHRKTKKRKRDRERNYVKYQCFFPNSCVLVTLEKSISL